MKIIILVFALAISGCTVQGQLVSSQGLIQGWEHKGFKNKKNGLELSFYAENDRYVYLHEKFFGVTTKDKALNVNNSIGKKNFLIRVKINAANDSSYIKQNAKLLLGSREYSPIKVKRGTDTALSGRIEFEIKPSEYGSYFKVNPYLKGGDHNWLWFEYDVETPGPQKMFSLLFDVKGSGKLQRLKVDFKPKLLGIYHH